MLSNLLVVVVGDVRLGSHSAVKGCSHVTLSSDFQTYDHFRDSYKMYIDGEQVESGTWAGDNPQDPVRPGAQLSSPGSGEKQ